MNTDGLNAYKSNSVLMAPQKKLIIMLYDGIIKNLKLSQINMRENKIEKANTTIAKAQDILTELMSTLNFDKGGDIAQGLFSLYQYMYTKTIQANISKNTEDLEEVISMIQDLRETWEKI